MSLQKSLGMNRPIARISFPFLYRFGQLFLDGSIAWLACSLAYQIRFEGDIPPNHQTLASILPLLAIVCRLSVQTAFGLYQHIWRLFGLRDAKFIFHAVTLYSLLVLVVTRTIIPRFIPFQGIPLGIAAIDWSLCFMGMVLLRYSRRWLLQQQQMKHYPRYLERERVVLVGAGMAGSQMVREVRQNPQLNWAIVGFVDDDPTKLDRQVEGVRVVGKTSQVVAIAERLQANLVIIAMPSADPLQIRQLVHQTQGCDLQLKVLPRAAEILRDRAIAPQVRNIEIQDLLGRAEIHLDFSQEFNPQFSSASEQIYGKTVLVTGAGGTIGSEICRQLGCLRPKTLILLGRGENSIFHTELELRRLFPNLHFVPIIADIRYRVRLEKIFQTWQPDIIFHAAAHKHVPLMQHNPTEALENNALGSARLASLASHHGVKTFVLISTDKAVDPCNFMGLSKRLAELMVKAHTSNSSTRFLVVRFGNVLGSRGSVVPIFKEQITKGEAVTVTDPAMTRYFMTTPEAAQLVIQSLAVGKSGQTLLLDMGQPVNIFNLAEQMIQLAGLTPNVDIPIEITGLRPGEKLHESLVSANEISTPTEHPKIMAVSNDFPTLEALDRAIAILTEAVTSNPASDRLWLTAQSCLNRLESKM